MLPVSRKCSYMYAKCCEISWINAILAEFPKRDMAFSDDEQQIRDILQFEIAENIKKGWEEVEFVK